jgi:meso-butanediol dehydrogenase / (S,S)-butanediol dehydrogenase / diacetyl reductase
MVGRLHQKVAIITGAASGIGAATARRFAQEGARVVVADIRGDGAEVVAAEIRSTGAEAIAVTVDVSNSAQVKALMEQTIAAYGTLNILYCNAGVLIPDTVEEPTEDSWHKTLAVNMTGTYLCCRHGIPELKKAGGGVLLITASISGMRGEKGAAAYNATKGGLVNLTKHLAVEYAGDRIRVNCLCPGWIDTPFNDPLYEFAGLDKASLDKIIPMGRQGVPEEVASAALFLASDDASYITGHPLMVDGGLMIKGDD